VTPSFKMLFISHSTLDKPAAIELQQRLLARGYTCGQQFLDSDQRAGIKLGERWEKVIYDNLRDCRALIVLCSPNWLQSKWCFAELAAAKMGGKEIFPVVLAECGRAAVAEYQAVFVNQPDPAAREQAFERLFQDLAARGLGPSDYLPWPNPQLKDARGQTDPCPYPGLPAFDERYAAVYFGRERETHAVLEELRRMRGNGEPRLMMVVGGSGSGKSSLLMAGLLPRLKHPTAGSEWLVLPTVRFARRDAPDALFDTLADDLAAGYPAAAGGTGIPDRRALRDQFAGADADQAAKAFLDAARALALARGVGGATVLLPIDQFEEFLTPSAGSAADRFLKFLARVCRHRDDRVLVIGTMRSDYLDVYERHPHALKAPRFRPWRLEPFPREQIENVILKPAARAHVEVAPDLLERLKQDASSADALPLLAFTLEKMYRRGAGDQKLDLSEYDDLGGMEGSIRTTADQIMPPNALPPAVESAVRLCFVKHLAQVNDRGDFVRLTARWEDLDPAAHPVLEQFVSQRLLVKFERDGEVFVEVAHEAIFRCWGPLAVWLRTSADIARWRRDVDRDRRSAVANGRAWAGLTGPQLAVARAWPRSRRAELGEDELAWIRGAVRKAEIRTGIWVAVGVLLAVSAGVAWWQKGVAEKAQKASDENAGRAEQQRQLAQARQLAADANALAKGPRRLGMLALLLALQAHQRIPTNESFRALDSLTELLPEVAATYQHDRSTAFSGAGLEFSPDGKFLVSAAGTTLIVFDVTAKQEVGRLSLQNEVRGERGVRVNRDGTLLAVSTGKRNGQESAVLIRHLPGLQEVRTVKFRRAVAGMAFSSGKLVATDREVVKVIALPPGNADGEFSLGEKVSAVAFSTDGEAVAVAAGQNIRLLSTAKGEVRRTIAPKLAKEEGVRKLVFSPDDKYLFSGTSEGMSATWTMSNEKDAVEKQERENNIDGVAWSGDGTRIAQIDAGEDYLCVWSAKDGTDLVASLTETEDSRGPSGFGAEFISGDSLVAWSRGPASIYALTQNKDRPRSQLCYDYDLHETSRLILDSNIQRAATSKDRRFVAAMSGTGQIVIWRLSSQRPRIAGEVAESPKGAYLQVVDGKSLSIIAADQLVAPEEVRPPVWKSSERFATGEFSEDERYFAAANKSRRVTVVDLTSSKVLTQARVKANGCQFRFVPHKGTLLMASGGQIQELDLKTLTVRERLTYTTRRTEVFSPSGRYFAARDFSSEPAKDDKRLELYDVESGKKIRDFQVNSFDTDVKFSADERLIASPQSKDVVSVWDIESGRQQCQCPVYTVALEFAFSPDSKRIAVSKGDTVRVWDVGDGKLALEAKREAGEYGSLAFSPDSAALAVGSRDYSVLPGVTLWSIPDGHLLIDVPFVKQIQSIQFSRSGQYLLTFQKLRRGENQPEELRTSWYLWRPEDVIARANKRKTRDLSAKEWQRYLPTEPLPDHLK
jgi:WD40 repeat protein